jgi:glycosyltransferase involved in cell wall biosynthesis
MVKVTAILSTYFDLQYLQGRLDNLIKTQIDVEGVELIVIAEKGSKEIDVVGNWLTEHLVVSGYCKIIETDGIPTLYSAWNDAIKIAEGEYITNTNTDDRLYPGALQKMVDILDANPDYGVVYPNVDRLAAIDGEPFGQFDFREGDFDILLDGCFLGPMPMWRRSLHDEYGYFDGDYHSSGDYEFWLRLALGGVKFYHIREVLGAYLDRKESVEHRQPNRTVWETARARSRYRNKNDFIGKE